MSRIIGSILAIAVAFSAAAQNYRADIIETKIICQQANRYIGWPSICKTKSGKLIAAFSGDRDQHVCPWGKSQIITSEDNGKTWSAPMTVNNTPLDDRDTGIIETAQGSLVITWFTSLAFEKRPEYARHAEKVTPETREQWLGHWSRRSPDGGATWEAPVRMATSAPHGPIALRDGRLMQVGKTLYGTPALAAEISEDEGHSWHVLAPIPIPAEENILHYHEPHVAELPDGKLVALFRYQPKDPEQHVMRVSESTDGGKTWNTTQPTTIWGYPPHLTVLNDGKLVVVYGRRKEPFSERACVSADGGKTWGNEITLCDAVSTDLGYPASVQLDDGSILTVYYQDPGPDKETSLWATHWRLVAE